MATPRRALHRLRLRLRLIFASCLPTEPAKPGGFMQTEHSLWLSPLRQRADDLHAIRWNNPVEKSDLRQHTTSTTNIERSSRHHDCCARLRS